MPMCPNCKTFYVADPCPNCEKEERESFQDERMTNEAIQRSKMSRKDDIFDFFGDVGTGDEVDIVTGRRKSKEALTSTPWHREQEIRSINQRKIGKDASSSPARVSATESKGHSRTLSKREPFWEDRVDRQRQSHSRTLSEREPFWEDRVDRQRQSHSRTLSERETTHVKPASSASPVARQPIVDKSIFNPVTTKSDRLTSDRKVDAAQNEEKLLPPKPLMHSGTRMVDAERQKAVLPPTTTDTEKSQSNLQHLPAFSESIPTHVNNNKTKESTSMSTSTLGREMQSTPTLLKSTNQEPRMNYSEESDIPAWLLASESQGQSFKPQKQEHHQKDAPTQTKKGIIGFLKRKLLRSKKSDERAEQPSEKVNLAATHVKAGGLTLPRWLIGEKVEETRRSTSSSSDIQSSKKPVASVSASPSPASVSASPSPASVSASPSPASVSASPSKVATGTDKSASPPVIDETLLELERKFKDKMPQIPAMPFQENLMTSPKEDLMASPREEMLQEENYSKELGNESSSFDDFDDFNLEDLAAQVMTQLEAPDIRETSHRLDSESLDMLESLAAEFLKETARKEGVVRTEVVRHDSITSLAVNPRYTEELKEIPGFEEEDTFEAPTKEQAPPLPIQQSSRLSPAPSPKRVSSSAVPLRKTQTSISNELPASMNAASMGSPSAPSPPSAASASSAPFATSATIETTFQRGKLKKSIVSQDTDSPVDLSDRPVVIAVEDLVKTYKLESGKEHRVLLGIQMEIYQGEWVAIVGPSGSGKSSFLNILGGLDNPTVGSVYILGKDITKMGDRELSQYRLKTVGFVFQFFNLVPELTAVENIEFPQRLLGVDRRKARARAEELLDWIGLWDVKDQRVDLLSGGEQQRVAICVALANDPPIILMDEPTGNLDKANTDLVMDIFESLNRDFGKTLVCVTHDLEVAARAHRIFSLVNGKLIEGKAIVD